MEEKDKLTIQEAAMYLGSQCKVKGARGPYKYVKKDILTVTVGMLLDYNSGDYFDDIELHLRTIEDMTEEDKIFIAKFIMKDLPSRFGEHHYEIDKYNGSVIVSVYNGGAILNVFYFNKNGIGRRYPINDFIVYKKLIELGFDLFDYIGQGKAIRKQ